MITATMKNMKYLVTPDILDVKVMNYENAKCGICSVSFLFKSKFIFFPL